MRKVARQKRPGGRHAGRGFGGGWPAQRGRARQRTGRWADSALECRSEPLGRSDRRPTGGTDEREEVVPDYDKRVYVAYTLTAKPSRKHILAGRSS